MVYLPKLIFSDFSSTSLRNVVTEDLSNTIDVNLTYTHTYEKPQRNLVSLRFTARIIETMILKTEP